MAKKRTGGSRKQTGARTKDMNPKKNPKGGVAVGALGYSIHIPQGVPMPPFPPKKP